MTERAQRRKSPWNLLLIPFVIASIIGLGTVGYIVLNEMQRMIVPGFDRPLFTNSVSSFFVFFGLFIACLAPALIASNYFVWLIPPARRALDREAKPFPSTQFRAANRALLKASALLVPIGGFVAFLAAMLSIWMSARPD